MILSAQSTYPLVSYRTGSFKEKATPSEIEKQRNARRKAEEKYKAKCIEFAIDISQMQAKINSIWNEKLETPHLDSTLDLLNKINFNTDLYAALSCGYRWAQSKINNIKQKNIEI